MREGGRPGWAGAGLDPLRVSSGSPLLGSPGPEPVPGRAAVAGRLWRSGAGPGPYTHGGAGCGAGSRSRSPRYPRVPPGRAGRSVPGGAELRAGPRCPQPALPPTRAGKGCGEFSVLAKGVIKDLVAIYSTGLRAPQWPGGGLVWLLCSCLHSFFAQSMRRCRRDGTDPESSRSSVRQAGSCLLAGSACLLV